MHISNITVVSDIKYSHGLGTSICGVANMVAQWFGPIDLGWMKYYVCVWSSSIHPLSPAGAALTRQAEFSKQIDSLTHVVEQFCLAGDSFSSQSFELREEEED